MRKERHIHRQNDRECEVEPNYREIQKRRRKEIVVEWEFIVRYILITTHVFESRIGGNVRRAAFSNEWEEGVIVAISY